MFVFLFSPASFKREYNHVNTIGNWPFAIIKVSSLPESQPVVESTYTYLIDDEK